MTKAHAKRKAVPDAKPGAARGARRHPARQRDGLQRRLRAAGLDTEPDDEMGIDALRLAIARKIAMAINRWRGCPEKQCRRQRGCMAPHIRCTNLEPMPPDPDGTGVQRVRAELLAAMRRMDAAAGDEA